MIGIWKAILGDNNFNFMDDRSLILAFEQLLYIKISVIILKQRIWNICQRDTIHILHTLLRNVEKPNLDKAILKHFVKIVISLYFFLNLFHTKTYI